MGEKGRHTPSSMMSCLLDAQRRRLDVLALARKLRVLRVVVHHVSGAAAAGGVDVLFDRGGDEVGGRGGRFGCEHVACHLLRVSELVMGSR